MGETTRRMNRMTRGATRATRLLLTRLNDAAIVAPVNWGASKSHRIVHLALAIMMLGVFSSTNADAASAQVARGKYLVTIAGCNDCHTPGYFLGNPDMSRYLGGSDVAFEIPGRGAFIGRNLTPDKDTGIGKWTKEQIVTALQTGVTPSGYILAPIMPWHAFAHFSKRDVYAIASYLKTLKPVHHHIPGPFGPGQKVPTFMFRIMPPGQTVANAPNKK